MGIRAAKVAVLAIAALSCAFAAPARSATVNAAVKAKVVKPLQLRSIQNFDLGTILLGTGSWSSAVVRLSRAGVRTCPATVTCSGATAVAIYNVSGSNQETVRINAPNVTMVNQSDPSKALTLAVDGPGTIVLPNSGNPGTNVPLGGSITLSSTTTSGTYVGTFQVTAEYQ